MNYLVVDACIDHLDRVSVAINIAEGGFTYPALVTMDAVGKVESVFEVKTDDAVINDLEVKEMRCYGRMRYLVGQGSNSYVSHASGQTDTFIFKVEIGDLSSKLIWARSLYISGGGPFEIKPAAFSLTDDDHWLYVGLHTIDPSLKQIMRWVKLSTIDGTLKIGKGSWTSAMEEKASRRLANVMSLDMNIWWVTIAAKVPAAGTWSAAIVKLDNNLDVMNYHYIQENGVNRIHDISTISISKLDRQTLYIGGRLDKGN